MRLYYPTALEWEEKALEKQRLKLPTILDANDLFELLGASVGGVLQQRADRLPIR